VRLQAGQAARQRGKPAASTGNSFSRNSPRVAIVHSSFAGDSLNTPVSRFQSTSSSAKRQLTKSLPSVWNSTKAKKLNKF